MPSGTRQVLGMAILNDEFFLVRREMPEVEVYDLTTYHLKQCWKIEALIHPWDMASAIKNQCLYITDASSRVHQVAIHGETFKLSCWPVNDEPNGISVTKADDFHVIVTCGAAHKLKEYTASGDLIKEISLPAEVINPWHAVQLSNGLHAVCHGIKSDSRHQVSIIDVENKIVHSYGGTRGSSSRQMNEPQHLAVDKDDNIFVADVYNERVLLLTPTLDVREFLSRRDIDTSRRLCLDEAHGHLYVANDIKYKSKKRSVVKNVLVFRVKENILP